MGKQTYQRVVDLLNEHIPSKISRNEFCRDTGINRNSIDRYRAGLGRPNDETLQKLADYFEVSVAWLRGEDSDTQALSYEELSNILCARGLGVPLEVAYRITKEVMKILPKRGTALPEVGTQERLDYINKVKRFVGRECGVFIKTGSSSMQKSETDYHMKGLLNELKELIERQTVNASVEERKKFVAGLIEQLSLACHNIDTTKPDSE